MKESRNRKKILPRIGHLTQEGEPVAVPPAFPQGSQAKTVHRTYRSNVRAFKIITPLFR